MQTFKIMGVVGAGTMGIGICEVAAANGLTVLLYDIDKSFAEKAVEAMASRLKKRVVKGKITQQQADDMVAAIKVVDDFKGFLVCDLVVEAIVENLAVKQQLFKELELKVSAETLLASNTSSLSITAIAAALKDPSRLIGLHFFNPAPVMKLVEVVAGLQTDEKLLLLAKKLCRTWGKVPVIAQSTPGFIVNRVARSFYGEALKMKQENLAEFHQIDAVMREGAGFRMGPFELMDLIGIDINYSVSQTVYQAMFNEPRFRPSLLQGEMVEANLLGKKTAKGFYQYTDGAVRPKTEYVFSDATFDQITVPEEVTHLSVLFSEFDYDKRKWSGTEIVISGCHIVLSDGRTAKQRETESQIPTCVVDLAFDYRKSDTINLAFGPAVDVYMRHRIIAVINHIGKNVIVTDDQPGLIAMRIVAMLINEAADTVFNGVCSAQDVDLAMCNGVNYPKGLLAFAEVLGWSHVATTLEYLQQWFGDDRYRLSPYIRNQL